MTRHACAFLLTLLFITTMPPAQSSLPAEKADRILIEKAARRMQLFSGKKIIRTYAVALGTNPVGHKQQEGDGRTPEGIYVIDWRNAESRFHRSLHISYPNEEDKKSAAARGVEPGGLIMIHGLPNGQGSLGADHRRTDWTIGCIAVTNEEIEEIWDLVPDGTTVEIRP